jgi:SNF2 family DNA or RNA helicase
MTLAPDLSGFISKYGSQLSDAAAKNLVPLFQPGLAPMPDLSEIETLRTSRHPSGKPFRFFPAQVERIAGADAAFKCQRTAWLICEPGTGKTAMSLAVAWLKLRRKNYRLLVMCPGHLVKKWKREAEWLLPNVECRVITDFQDMVRFQHEASTLERPMVAVIGKDTAKLGIEMDKPSAASRKLRIQSTHTMTGAIEITDIPIAVCPQCGNMLKQKDRDTEQEYPYVLNDYLAQDRVERCTRCGDRLATAHCPPRRYAKPHLDRYIQRHMPGVFDMLIADEVHELASADSAQGNTFGTLSSACKYVLALTGTLIGGKASDLHATLWRMSPQLLLQRGFNLKRKRSAIASNERAFTRRYGVMERQVEIGRSRPDRGQQERPRPGISPDLFNHFLMSNAVFMSLCELGPSLPPLERKLVPVQPSRDLLVAYRFIDHAFAEAMKMPKFRGKGPPILATLRVMVLDAFLDKPWGWKPITAPIFDGTVKCGTGLVTEVPDLGDLHVDNKDRQLLQIIQSELADRRKCAIYPQYTGVHDVRPKLVALLKNSGIRVMELPDNIKPVEREEWIEQHEHLMDVLIVHPKRVMTGLDLIQFPSLIWYQTGYSTHVLRQASARARRPIQTKTCKLFYLYYQGTMQEQAMSLMGEKEAASQMLEGVFDCEALRALMNGSEDDDIMAALANSLGKEIDAKAAWSKVREPDPIAQPVDQFVFDLDLVEDVIFS